MKIAAIFLAAGQSRRFGIEDKLFVNVQGLPLCYHALENLLKVSFDKVFVITRQEQQHMFTSFLEKVHIINPQEDCGQAESLRLGILQAEKVKADGVIIVLADQPFITKEALEQLIYHFERNRETPFIAFDRPIIAPPLLISKSLFAEIKLLKGDTGARNIILKYRSEGLILNEFNQEIFFDVDTYEDYERLKQNITQDFRC